MKYDYARTDDAVIWEDKETVLDYLQRSPRVVGPFAFKLWRGVYNSREIEAYVNKDRILRGDIVYSYDPEVIAAVAEAAEYLRKNAVQARRDMEKYVAESKLQAAEEKASLFKNAARLWNKGRK
jgi:hypothetical protein